MQIKYSTAIFLINILFCGCIGTGNKIPEPITVSSVNYTKADLLKVKWIEGKWKGMDGDDAFYEMYEFVNDSTIKTISFDWKGKDSSKSFVDHLYWKDGLYYLGGKQDWAANIITDSMVKLQPNSSRIHNDITWKQLSDTSWDAILVSPKGTKEYHMKRFNPFKK